MNQISEDQAKALVERSKELQVEAGDLSPSIAMALFLHAAVQTGFKRGNYIPQSLEPWLQNQLQKTLTYCAIKWLSENLPE